MSKKNITNKRFLWADIIRSLAITLVVFAHVSAPAFPQLPNSFDSWTSTFYGSFSRLGVPLFVMLSGALILPKKQPYLVFFKRRFNRILFPWIFWTLIYSLWFMVRKNTPLIPYDLIQLYYQTLLGQFWFLPMLLGLYFLTPLIWKFLEVAKEYDIFYAIGIWFLLVSILPFLQHIVSPGLSLSTSYVVIHSGYYLLGYFIVTSQKKISSNILLLGYIASIGINTLGQGLVQLSGRTINFFMQNISPFIVLATLTLFTFLYQLSQNIETKHFKKLEACIVFISGISMGVFFVHGLVMYVFDTTSIGRAVSTLPIPYFFAVPFRTLVIFALSGGVILLLRRVPVLKILAQK